MKNFKRLALGTVAAIALSTSGASAMEASDFTSHHLVNEATYDTYVEQLEAEDKLEIREYLNYEQREPCQFYQPIPEGFMKKGCDIVPATSNKVVSAPEPEIQNTVTYSHVLEDYEINFALDSASIEPAAGYTLDTVAKDIRKYDPSEVTVEGYADTSGSAEHNVALSQKRAMTVSQALTERGVSNRVIDAEAYGESNLAVPTDDGVRLRENRRVVIEFRK